MMKPIALILGIALLLHPFWGKKHCRTKSKRVVVAVGLALLCWWGIAVWLGLMLQNSEHNQDTWDAMLHVKRVLSGVIIGLILSLIIQGELFPSSNKPDAQSDR
jgi:type III secretory pathway component EscT